MELDSEGRIKVAFSRFNRAVLNSLTSSQNQDRHRLGTVIESELENLSRTVKKVCDPTSEVEAQTQGQHECAAAPSSYRAAVDTTTNTLWKQYESIASFNEHQRYYTPVLNPELTIEAALPLLDTANMAQSSIWMSMGGSEEIVERDTHARDSCTSVAPVPGSDNDSAHFVSTLLPLRGLPYVLSPTNFDSSYSYQSMNTSAHHSSDPVRHDIVWDSTTSPHNIVNSINLETHHFPYNLEYVGDLEHTIITDTEGESTDRSITCTHQDSENPQSDHLIRGKIGRTAKLPAQLRDCTETRNQVSKTVKTNKPHVLELLARLTHVMGSAEALTQLKTSVGFARRKGFVTGFSQDKTSDLTHTMQALDMLDTVSHHSSILRRYYLVQLLRYRLQREADCYKERAKSEHKGKKSRDALGGDERPYRQRRPRTQKIKSERPIRADSQALQEMMKALYPCLQPPSRDQNPCNMSEEEKEYERLLARLKNRLACARNWHQFAEYYTVGILAIIPSGSRSGISSDSVEKLPAGVIAGFLDFLQEIKGPFLHVISSTLSEHIFEILCGCKEAPMYQFERVDDATILTASGDLGRLQDLCSVDGNGDGDGYSIALEREGDMVSATYVS